MENILNIDIIDAIKNELVNNDINITDDIFDKLSIYYRMLIEYNEKTNLTAITEINDVYTKHFLDSILFSKLYKYGSTVCDIGTGAGFPGVVLKIIRPDLKVVLVDSLNKRVTFLQELIDRLNLSNIVAMHYRAEDIEFKEKYLNSFDYVVARAVAEMPILTEYCLPYVRVGGNFIAYKGLNYESELSRAERCIRLLGGKTKNILNKDIYNNSRAIIIIEKITRTPFKYPRNGNKPRLKPIL